MVLLTVPCFDLSPKQECLAKERHFHSQRENALKEVQADGWVVARGCSRGYPRGLDQAKGLGRDRRYGGRMVLANQGDRFWGTVMHAMAMAKKIRICIYIYNYIYRSCDPILQL